MSPKQLAKCCLYYKEEVLGVIVVINWSGLWGRSWLCWGLTACRRWRSTSPSLWRRHLPGERGKGARGEQRTIPELWTHFLRGLNSLSSDKAQPPCTAPSSSSWSEFLVPIPAPVVLRLFSQFCYFPRCLLIIIWYFSTIFLLFLVSPILYLLWPWRVPAPLPCPVLLIQFLCMVCSAMVGRALLFYITFFASL